MANQIVKVVAMAISNDKTRIAVSERLANKRGPPQITIYNLTLGGSGMQTSSNQVFTYTDAKMAQVKEAIIRTS